MTRTITPEMVTAASLLVRITHSDDASLARALGKAEERLFDLPWTVVEGLMQIASYSHPSDVHTTDGDTCTCPTSRGRCYHIACWYILSTICAAGINPVAPLPLPSVTDEDDLPASSFLDGPFDAFDDAELTAPVAAARGVWYKGEYFTPEQLNALEQARGDAPAFIECDELPVFASREPTIVEPFRLQPSREIPNPLDALVDELAA
jgi:hypothetical protein